MSDLMDMARRMAGQKDKPVTAEARRRVLAHHVTELLLVITDSKLYQADQWLWKKKVDQLAGALKKYL